MTNYDYEDIPTGYYDEIYKKKAGVQSSWHNIKFEFVSKFIDINKNHLDVGCGPGTFLGNYLPNNSSAIGIDVATKQVEYAKSAYPTNSFYSYSTNFPFNDHFFDSISIIEVIEHLQVDVINKILLECKRCLKPGGRIIITTPNYNSLWPMIEVAVNFFSEVNYEDQHITKFTQKSLSSLITHHGFSIIERGSMSLIAPFLSALSWELARKISDYEFKFRNHSIGNILYIVCRDPNKEILTDQGSQKI